MIKFLKIFFIALFNLIWSSQSFAFDCTSQTEIPTLECEALNTFYTNTNGDSWTDNTGWNGTSPCTAYGVNCDMATGHVRDLMLVNNQLSGSIPPEIDNLTNLVTLRLKYNQLTGSIPIELGNMTNLASIAFTGNQLSGNIPTQIGNLTNLSWIDFEDNQLSGNIPPQIGNLTSLTTLHLGRNELSGNIPAEIGNLTNLTFLGLDSNQFDEGTTIPVWLGVASHINCTSFS